VVHLAAPAVLGAAGAVAARQQGLPAVAVYQTDLAAYAASYGAQPAGRPIWTWLRWVHRRADLTLAPSTDALRRLRRHGIDRLARWGRGVDTELFRPGRRDPALVASLSEHGRRLVVGYVGRLASEKSVDLLAPLAGRDDISLVVVGDGPVRAELERQLPGAWFAGMRSGPDLARIFASLDVSAHTGHHETFCQSVQEALASGVAVVAPAIGGPLDLVRHGHNGLLWSPWRPAELVAAVERLRDPDLRRRLAVAARASVAGRRRRGLERYGAEVIAREPNRTLTWLTGERVDRLVTLRRLDRAVPLAGAAARVDGRGR
jgi:phosphatidylinositol alpha 1,6-mannosyltransferase